MEIKASAIAGTLESSDVQVTVLPATDGIDLSIQSSVMNRFGRQIKQMILDTLNNLNVKNGKIVVIDKGALDCTLKARVEGAVFRSCGRSTKNIPWGNLK